MCLQQPKCLDRIPSNKYDQSKSNKWLIANSPKHVMSCFMLQSQVQGHRSEGGNVNDFCLSTHTGMLSSIIHVTAMSRVPFKIAFIAVSFRASWIHQTEYQCLLSEPQQRNTTWHQHRLMNNKLYTLAIQNSNNCCMQMVASISIHFYPLRKSITNTCWHRRKYLLYI